MLSELLFGWGATGATGRLGFLCCTLTVGLLEKKVCRVLMSLPEAVLPFSYGSLRSPLGAREGDWAVLMTLTLFALVVAAGFSLLFTFGERCLNMKNLIKLGEIVPRCNKN
jgi:hypothetical protein